MADSPRRRMPRAAPAPSASDSAPLRVLMVASEAHPFSKTGGLADVATSLTAALGRLGHRVTLFTPRYRGVAGGERRDRSRVRRATAGSTPTSRGAARRQTRARCSSIVRRSTTAPASTPRTTPTIRTTPCALRFCRSRRSNGRRRSRTPLSIIHGTTGRPACCRSTHGASAPSGAAAIARSCRAMPSVFTIHNLAFQGRLRQDVGAAARAALGRLHRRRLRVLGSPQLPQGGRHVQRRAHDGEPDLRRRDPAAGVRLRVRRRHPRARAMR